MSFSNKKGALLPILHCFYAYFFSLFLNLICLITLGGVKAGFSNIRSFSLPQLFAKGYEEMGIFISRGIMASGLILFSLFFARYASRRNHADYLSLKPVSIRKNLWVVFNTLFLYMIISITFGLFHVQAGPGGLYSIAYSNVTSLVFYFVSFSILTGFGEELLFRGYVQTALVEKLGAKAGLVIASLLFAFFHLDLTNLFIEWALTRVTSYGAQVSLLHALMSQLNQADFSYLFWQITYFIIMVVVGLYFGTSVLISKSIWPAIISHIVFNTLFLIKVNYVEQLSFGRKGDGEPAFFPYLVLFFLASLFIGNIQIHRPKKTLRVC